MRLALVTGGGKRIGRGIALELARQGYGVLVHYRASADEANLVVRECERLGAPFAAVLHADFSDPYERAGFMTRACAIAPGNIDLLVNSASAFEYDDPKTFTADKLQAHLATNFIAPVEFTMQLHSISSAAAVRAHSVVLLDQKVFNLNTDYTTYTIAKLACHSSIRFLAQCCAPWVRVNGVAPGVTLVSGDMTAQEFGQAHRVAALGKSSTVGDIASAVLMLDQALAVTGQTIAVDGGQHLIPRARDVAFEIANEKDHLL